MVKQKEPEARKRPTKETSTTTVSGFFPRFWGKDGRCRAALYDRNGRWFVIKGFRSISAKVVVLIDRIIVLNDRKISPRPLCNAKCHIRKRLLFILEMFTKLSSSVLTSPLYRTAPKTPSRQCNASGACGTVRLLSTNLSGY